MFEVNSVVVFEKIAVAGVLTKNQFGADQFGRGQFQGGPSGGETAVFFLDLQRALNLSAGCEF